MFAFEKLIKITIGFPVMRFAKNSFLSSKSGAIMYHGWSELELQEKSVRLQENDNMKKDGQGTSFNADYKKLLDKTSLIFVFLALQVYYMALM